MLQKIKVSYHQFIEGVCSPRFQTLLDNSPTNKEMVQNAGELEKSCLALIPHTQAIVDLTTEGSNVHKKATERLNTLQETYARTQQYKQIGDLADKLFSSKNL